MDQDEQHKSINDRLPAKRLGAGLMAGIFIGCLTFVFFIQTLIDDRKDHFVNDDRRANTHSTTNDVHSIGHALVNEMLEEEDALQRSQTLSDRLDNLNLDQLLTLIDQSSSLDPTYHTHALQELLFGVLAQENPKRALESIWKFPNERWNDLLVVVLGEWAIESLAEALRATKGLIGSFQESAVRVILAELDVEDYASVLNIAKSIGMESIAEKYIQENQAATLLEQPRQAWNLVVHDNVRNIHQRELLVRIVDEWKKEIGFEVLDYPYDELYYTDAFLYGELLASVISSAPKDAFEHVLEMPLEKQNEIAPRLLGQWAETDPEAALLASDRIAMGTTRRTAISYVMYSWSLIEPHTLLEKVESIPRSMWQEAVRNGVGVLAQSDPELAAEHLERLKPFLGEIEIFTEFTTLIEGWATIDPIAALRWIDENVEKRGSRKSRLEQRVVSSLASVDPEEAMKLALAEGVYSDFEMSGAEIHVIYTLVPIGKLNSAVEMLDRVRPLSKLSAVLNIAGGMLHSDQTDRAMSLAEHVPEGQQKEFFVNLSQQWFDIDPKGFLEQLANFPSKKIQTEVARAVLRRTEFSPDYLTKEQQAQLSSYLPNADSD